MKSRIQLALLILAGGLLAPDLPVMAEDSTNEIDELKQEVQALDQKLRILERKQELDQDAAAEKSQATARTMPVITAGANGFVIRSADTNFSLALHGHIQVDSRTFLHEGQVKGISTFLLRRARPILQGTLYRDFDFMFIPDFGGNTVQIFDAYLNYRLRPELQIEGGKFKSPVGLETLQSDANILFNERSLATDLVPNRDVGFLLHGDLWGGAASYAAGILNGATDYSGTAANADFDNNKAFAGRLFFQPFRGTSLSPLKGLGLGVGGSYQVDRATNSSSTGLTSGYSTDGQQKFFSYSPTNGTVYANGDHWRIAPQGYYYYGPLGIMGEYVVDRFHVANTKLGSAELQNRAWDLSTSWVLTGEDATYNGVTPRHPFDPRNGDWGAVQLVGRYAGQRMGGGPELVFEPLDTRERQFFAHDVCGRQKGACDTAGRRGVLHARPTGVLRVPGPGNPAMLERGGIPGRGRTASPLSGPHRKGRNEDNIETARTGAMRLIAGGGRQEP
jgi:phosphate-selective porin OprO/OprP